MIHSLDLPLGYEFHHVGYATKSIVHDVIFFESLGYKLEGETFSDPIQGITGCFMVGPGPRIELLENLPDSNILTPWVDAGIKIYHFAYWVDDIHQAIDWATGQRAKVIFQPSASIAFGGRNIAFVMFRNGFILEFIESQLRTLTYDT